LQLFDHQRSDSVTLPEHFASAKDEKQAVIFPKDFFALRARHSKDTPICFFLLLFLACARQEESHVQSKPNLNAVYGAFPKFSMFCSREMVDAEMCAKKEEEKTVIVCSAL